MWDGPHFCLNFLTFLRRFQASVFLAFGNTAALCAKSGLPLYVSLARVLGNTGMAPERIAVDHFLSYTRDPRIHPHVSLSPRWLSRAIRKIRIWGLPDLALV